MRRSYFRLLEGVLLSFPLLFASCGNGDNALEEIINGGGSGGSGEVTAATITTAPTATAGDILAGSTTALVTAGVADGGTLMYKATSDNTQPTSTDGFSAEMPTAAALAMGTYFVWYYAKAADAQHTDSEIAATPVEVTVQPGLSTPLTIEAISQGKITVTSPKSGMKFSKDGGVTKINISGDADISVAAGDKVAFYGLATSYSGTKIGGADDGGTFKCKVYGNIMSLLYEDFADRTELPADDTFYQLFKDNARLTDASGLLLPAKTLKAKCYMGMFDGCTSLITAPKELPATTLQNYCYNGMFYGCTSLITAPKELPATTLQNNCYYYMFYGCTNLATAPALSATTLANFCCALMFQNCSSLTTAPELKAETLKPSCYNQMFFGCSKLSSVTCLATTLDSNGCNNWLNGAGTDASVTSRTLHIKAGGLSTTDPDWKLDTSGNGSDKKWEAVADQ
jgi:hypothetical protein